MDLTSDHPFWSLKNGLLATYPPLLADESCDIVILGAGITGSLVAEALTADGHDVVVIDRRDVGFGSTSASTALLQYEIDEHLIDLIRMHGREKAEAAYRACHESIDMLERKALDLGIECGFRRKDSVYLASRKADMKVLREEGEARRAMGIEVFDWSPADVKQHFGFEGHGALHSTQAAEVDPYRLGTGLLEHAVARGGRIYDRTEMSGMEYDDRGVKILTNRGFSIRAKRIVVAMGYEAQERFDTGDCVTLKSSFALASDPLRPDQRWWKECLLWESARPYFYLRTDASGRAILGGEDVPFRNPAARDRLVGAKAAKLEKRFNGMFPQAGLETAYAWAGTFGETADGLAYIGAHRNHPLAYFALGFGGNGVTYSMIAAEIIAAELRGENHRYAEVFRFERLAGGLQSS